jgi:SM-20-related protein
VVDESIRSTRWADVSPPAREFVVERPRALRPALAEHFGVPLSASQPPQFLAYRPVDYYRPHKDASRDDPPGIQRRVSVVLFLNRQAAAPGSDAYGGGALTFYGLIGGPRGRALGFPLTGETGLLAAFRSETVHVVAPLTHGDRYAVVSWFV